MIEEIRHHFIATEEGKNAKWIHLENPNETEIKQIIEEYQLPRDFITSGLDEDEPSHYESHTTRAGIPVYRKTPGVSIA